MKQKIIDLLIEKHKRTDGGMTLISLGESLKITQEELKKHLSELYQEKQIIVRKSINHKLIYIKQNGNK